MPEFTAMLANILQRPVIDQTESRQDSTWI